MTGFAILFALVRLSDTNKDYEWIRYGYVVLQKDALPTGQSAGERTLRRRIEAGLGSALGAPIWDDARTTIWAPWRDALPCSANPPARDETPAEPLQDRAVKVLGR